MTTELESPATDVNETTDVIVPITLELGKSDMTRVRSQIAAQKARYDSIIIAGPDDRAGLEIAKKARRVLTKTRTSIDERRQELNEPLLKEQRENNAVAKELIGLIDAIETPLDGKIKAIEQEKERIKAEIERAEADKIAGRINALNLLGAVYSENQYDVFGVVIESIEVTALPDEAFQVLLDAATTAYNVEQTRLADLEAERKAEQVRVKAEQQRVADEQEVERLKLQAISDENRRVAAENARIQAEFYEKQRVFEQQQRDAEKAEEERKRAIEHERKVAQWASRVSQLEAIGFVDRGPWFEHPDSPMVVKPYIGGLSDEEFTGFLESAVDATRQREERDKQAVIDEAARVKIEKQAEADRKKADKERAKRLAPDKNKLSKSFVTAGNSPAAQVVEQEAIDLQIEFFGRLHELVKEFQARLIDL